MPTEEAAASYKRHKGGLMPTLVPMATIIVSLLCLLLSLALIKHKMALGV